MQFICTKLRKSAELGNELKQKCGEWREAMEKQEAQDITSFTISSQVNLFSLDVKTENNRDFTIDAVMKDMV